ncbi:gliding motility-associated protein GldE [Flavobacteriaceae bacterium]|nr:gliding motility-associated protein GldE [Flavobacteriaceae bacterium]MDB4186832.1 gliding motility-associated protein GldE [Flavobacteriaceae bacterium]
MDPEPSLFIMLVLLPTAALIKWILLGTLLLASALISGAEVAFFSLTPSVIEQAKESQPKRTEKIERLLKQPKRLLATILVANNFINIAIVLLFANLSNSLLSGVENELTQLFIEVVVITFIILLFGEILPKIYANRNNLSFAQFMAGTIYALDAYFLFYLTRPMSYVTHVLEKRFGQRSSSFSVDELSQALELTEQNDTTQEEDKILQGIVAFGNTDTKQVMCPRVDVFALSTSMSLDEILPQLIEEGYSRIPVYKERLDIIEGILYSKDLMPNLHLPNFDWTTLLRPAYFVPENKKLDDLLKEFQQKKIHIAVVVDEYGGTSGVVTLEDLIEEIVGDITDEFDDEDIEYSKIDEKNYVFEAKVSLKDFYRITDLPIEEEFEKAKGEAETLGGFIIEVAGQLPRLRQKLNFENISFTIESVDKKRIKRVKVTLP